MGVVGDRSRAAASLAPGSLELLVHRRLLADDGRGVGQGLNENTRIISRNYLVANAARANVTLRRVALEACARPLVMFGGPRRVGQHDGLPTTLPFPPNLHLLSRELMSDGRTVLLRIQHLYAIHDDPVMSQPASVDICNVFPGRTVVAVTETDLNGVTPLRDVTRMRWRTERSPPPDRSLPHTP